MNGNEIDLIIVATATPDMQFPSTATIVQQKLGITNGCPAFDVQAVCAGFMYALTTANAYIKSGMAKNALVIGAETFSRIVDWNDRTTCVLFGDGAGAVVLSASDEPGIIHAKLKADGNYLKLLNVPGQIACGKVSGSPYISMDGLACSSLPSKCCPKSPMTLSKKQVTPPLKSTGLCRIRQTAALLNRPQNIWG